MFVHKNKTHLHFYYKVTVWNDTPTRLTVDDIGIESLSYPRQWSRLATDNGHGMSALKIVSQNAYWVSFPCTSCNADEFTFYWFHQCNISSSLLNPRVHFWVHFLLCIISEKREVRLPHYFTYTRLFSQLTLGASCIVTSFETLILAHVQGYFYHGFVGGGRLHNSTVDPVKSDFYAHS